MGGVNNGVWGLRLAVGANPRVRPASGAIDRRGFSITQKQSLGAHMGAPLQSLIALYVIGYLFCVVGAFDCTGFTTTQKPCTGCTLRVKPLQSLHIAFMFVRKDPHVLPPHLGVE